MTSLPKHAEKNDSEYAEVSLSNSFFNTVFSWSTTILHYDLIFGI